MGRRIFIQPLIACCFLILSSTSLAAGPLRLCVGIQALPPYLFPNKDGTIQILIRMAAEQSGLQVKFEAMPLPKCVEEIKAGNMQGSSAMGATPQNQEFVVFPKKNNIIDNSESVVAARSSVFRMKGSKADWNGKNFSTVKLPVLFATGNSIITEKLKALKTPYNDDTLHFQKNLLKMIAGQGDLVIGLQAEGKIRLEEPEFAGKIEELPAPFLEAYYFVAISKKYYDANTAQVENLWNAISKMKTNPAYLAAIKNISGE